MLRKVWPDSVCQSYAPGRPDPLHDTKPASNAHIQVVETAAPKGMGLAELEEAVLLQAEVMDLKASRVGRAEATVVEARRDKGQGPIATVIIKRGRLQVGASTLDSAQG